MALVWKVLGYINEVAPPVSKTVCQDDRQRLWSVATERIAHLGGRAEFGFLPKQQAGEILARVTASGKEQCYAMRAGNAHDPGGEQSGAVVRRLARKTENPHAGIVVMNHQALSRLPHQLTPYRCQYNGGCRQQLPRGGGGQRNSKLTLQPLQPVKRDSAAILQHRDDADYRRVVLPMASACGRLRGKNLSAQIATQRFQFVPGRLYRRLSR